MNAPGLPALVPRFAPGDPVPWFVARSPGNPEYHFHTVAGRHVVLLFAGSMRVPAAAAAWSGLRRRRELFDDERASLFVLSADRDDELQARLADELPGIRVLWDDAARTSMAFGVAAADATAPGSLRFALAAVVLDPTLRVMRWFSAASGGPEIADAIADFVAALPRPIAGAAQMQAPVLVLPRVFEPEFCRRLIEHYERNGGQDSGYMRQRGGRVEGVIDHRVKRRSDCLIEDEALKREIGRRFLGRVNPELQRVFRFRATRMERYLVACYDAQVGGYFRPHRDNEGGGHREFAVTLNLNAEDYEGGDLCFPEYGRQTYRAPTGGACIFSCGLMHEATPVRRGRRYAFLPFLYDEAAAQRREANSAQYLDPDKHYRYQAPGKG